MTGKPLVGLFQPHKIVPAIPAAWIQQWALLRGPSNYVIKHKFGKANAPADALRRLPVTPVTTSMPSEPAEEFDSSEYIPFTPAKQLAVLTAQDENLTEVKKCVHENWPIAPTEKTDS